MTAPGDHLKSPQSPKELQKAEVTTFQKVLNHANYKGKPWMPYQIPMETKGGVKTYYPPLFTTTAQGEELVFTTSHKQFPANAIGKADSRTGFTVMVFEKNKAGADQLSGFIRPDYVLKTEFSPGSEGATDERSKFLELMHGALVQDASVADISLPKDMKEFLSGANISLDLIVRKETDKFPPGYIDTLPKLTDLDLSKHHLQEALYQDNINPGSKGEYKGNTLKPHKTSLTYTMQLASYTQCPKGEPIKPGLKLIVRNKPDLLTTEDVVQSSGDVLDHGKVNQAPEITEVIDIGDILNGKATESSYVVLRDGKQVKNPYPFTQPSHVEQFHNFQLLRLHECLASYRQ